MMLKFDDLTFMVDQEQQELANVLGDTAKVMSRARMTFGQYILSVIHFGKTGMYEIAVIDAETDKFVRLPGIMSGDDDVMPYMTEPDVESIMKKLYFISEGKVDASN